MRAQLLATEHASLLATRNMTWNEIFSRANMFFTVRAAAVIALALVAQATGFGPGFRLFAVLVARRRAPGGGGDKPAPE